MDTNDKKTLIELETICNGKISITYKYSYNKINLRETLDNNLYIKSFYYIKTKHKLLEKFLNNNNIELLEVIFVTSKILINTNNEGFYVLLNNRFNILRNDSTSLACTRFKLNDLEITYDKQSK